MADHGQIMDLILMSGKLKQSPDLTPCDFYLWGRAKEVVYRTQNQAHNLGGVCA